MTESDTNDEKLVAVFSPPLALMLARAEELKGAPLTREEVTRIRDNAPCTMVPAAVADEMRNSRGYRDVEPENCWADWHRLRVQISGQGCLPKLVLCVPGDAEFPPRANDALASALASLAAQISREPEDQLKPTLETQTKRDERLVQAFKQSNACVGPSLSEADFQQIEQHQSLVFLVSPNFTSEQAPLVAHALVRAGALLLEAGGTAIKCESSGVGHSKERWLELAAEAGDEPEDTAAFWKSLFRAYVQFPIASDTDYFTCGMHLLGSPDVIISRSLMSEATAPGKREDDAAAYLFYMFCLYVLIKCGTTGFVHGHTFQPDQDWPRLRLIWEDCEGYDADDLFFNPFGRWRFVEVEEP